MTEEARAELGGEVSGDQIEQLVDELILFANISVADPPRLPLPDHVHRLVSLNRSPGRLEFAKALLGLSQVVILNAQKVNSLVLTKNPKAAAF